MTRFFSAALLLGTFLVRTAAAQSPPVVSVAPHNQTFTSAVQGTAAAAFATPSYISGDEERSVVLAYSSGMASPTALVQVDATVGSWATALSIRVRTQAGAWMTFTNGTQELFYTASSSGPNRLAAQLDVSSLASGAYTFFVAVRGYDSNELFWEANSIPIRVLVLNGRTSPYGAGWRVEGVQSLVPTTSGVFVDEGDGSARWFAYPGTCVRGYNSNFCGYTSPDGDFSQLSKNSQTGGYVRMYPSGLRVEYTANGRMTSVADAWSITRYAYDTGGRVTTVTDPTGKVIQLGYDGSGKLAWIQDPSGRQVTTRVLASGVLDQICDPAGCPFNAGFDALRRMTWRSDRGGARWDYEYDAHGGVSRVLSPAVAVDGQGTVRPATSLRGLEAAMLPAPGTGNLLSPAPRVVPGNITLSVTDPNSNVTRLRVDRFGAPVYVEEPLGRVSTVERDQHGRPTRVTAFNGDVTEMTYLGSRPLTVRDVTNNRTTTFTWQQYLSASDVYPAGTRPYDYPLQVNTPGEPTVRYERYGTQPFVTQKGSSRFYNREWDLLNRPAESFGPGGHMLRFYSPTQAANTDSVMSISGTDTLTTRYERDGLGRVVRTVNSRGVETTVVYDAINRVQSTTGPTGTTSYGYSPAGWLQTLTDPKGQQTVYTRNALGWMTAEQDPRGGVFTSTYDAAGQMVSATNRRGQTVRYEFDALGRMTQRTTAEGFVTSYASDPGGLWTMVKNGESADTIRNLRGAAPSVNQVTVRGRLRYALNTARDTVLRQTRVTTSWGYGVTHVLESLQSGRVGEVRDDRIGASTFITRDETLNRTIRRLPSGDSIIQGVLDTRYTDPSSGGLLDRGYQYDAQKWLAQRMIPGVQSESYVYDDAGQLAQEARLGSGAQPLSLLWYTYDAVGNPTHSGAGVTTGNRLESFDGYTLTYDADGNLVRKYKPQAGIDWTYTWNSLGQLTRAEGTSNGGATGWNVTTYGYDGSGRRVRKTVNGVVTRYLFDGYHVVAETDAAGAVTREFTYYEGVDRPHSMRTGGQTYYYVRDHQGNVTGLVNSTGAVVNRYEYTSFGAAAVAVEGVANPLRFAGGWYDAETGLHFNRMRYYDAALQRFASEDPLGMAAGPNPYAYAGNNPLNLTDPTGLNPEPCASWATRNAMGVCVQTTILVLPGISTGTGIPEDSDWYKKFYHERDYDTNLDLEYAYENDIQAQYELQQDLARINEALQSTREALDLSVGFVPGISTAHDASVLLTGYNVITGDKVGWGGRGIALIGMVTPASGGEIRGIWAISKEGTGRVLAHSRNKAWKFFEHVSTGHFWSKDTAGHGGSVWKVFKSEGDGLHWMRDADQYGDYITGKYKGPTGTFIPWSDLNAP